MKKLAIAALSAASVAFVATADTPATPRDATALGTIVLEENFEDYAKVTTNANGTVVVQAARNDGTVVDATVYTKDKVDTLVTGAGSVVTEDGVATITVNGDSAEVYTKDTADSTFKAKQTAVSDPTANGTATAFIATASQDANGKITVTKKTVASATTSAAGIVQLNSATNSTAENQAATPKAVKAAYDLANGKQDPATTLSGYGITDAKVTAGTGDNAGKDTVTLGSTETTVYNTTKMDTLLSGKKNTQTAVSDPTASGTGIAYIATIAQDAQGVITTTKSTVRSATTSQTGVVQLSSATNSSDEDKAATPKAVKAAYDLANGKQDPETTLSGYGITDAYTKTQTDSNITTATNALATAVAGAYKPLQTATTSPTTDSSSKTVEFIDTISQNANGVITATKKAITAASTSTAGIVQLNNTTTSTSTSLAATANAVKLAKDAADAKVPLSNVKVTPAAGGASSAITSSTVVELGNAFIICTTTGEGATAKKKAVLYAR